jgi:O-antigen/teichoic acid export membrane protein
MIPYISEESNNKNNLMKIYRSYKKKLIILMTIVTISSYILIPLIINVFFGYKYTNSIKYFKILLIGLYIFSLYTANVTLFIGTGEVKYNFYYGLFFFTINISIQYVLINKIGIIGAAYGSNFSFLLSLVFNEIMTRKILNNN